MERIFQELGIEFDSGQNPVYLVRTFPEKLTPAGVPAYEKWEGGLLGVTSKQINNFNDFCDKWFIEP